MAEAPAFNRWMFDRLAGWIGSRVLEIGSGIGNMSQFFIDRDQVVLTDTESAYRLVLQAKFGARGNVAVVALSLPHLPGELSGRRFDTIVCLNVLEHIDDDIGSLEAMYSLLEPAGKLVLLVPAFPGLYGSLDRALGHYRRYTRKL
ncbi:MAG: class I SAM-dependent methyltransferase, partial [Gemmatimonadetes bacterium]|nr:class I SAM-dependent methyltransferase [Gemmatimonadota bacterium]